MATTLFSPFSSLSITTENRDLGFLSKSSFLLGSLPFSSSSFSHHGNPTFSRRCFKSPCAQISSSDHVPKQFRQDNLKDGMMDNFKNVPQHLYGLSPSQMDMFMTEDNPVRRLSEKVTEQSISSATSYLDNGGMSSCRGMDNRGPSKYSMSVGMYGGGGRGFGRARRAPPDLPSLLLDARIVYLGMPISPAVAELLVAQFMWLDYDNSSKPIYLYINSPGTQNEEMENVGSETDAYTIADSMIFCKSDVYTVNCAMAYGQAAMLLSLGKKGFRALQPSCLTKLHLPKVYRSSGVVSDMWIKAKELEANTDSYIELLAKGIGKSKEELAKDLQLPKYFLASKAIEYGVADRIVDPRDAPYEKGNYDMRAQSKAMRKGGPGQASAGPSGFRRSS